MSLVKCKECGHQVSDSAKNCPGCGAKVPAKAGCGTVISIAFIAYIIYSVSTGTSSLSKEPRTYTVTYYVEGSTSSASLTYENEQGGTQQEIVRVPWRKTLEIPRNSFLYISAQNQNSYGDLSVSIWVDGIEYKRSEATGGYTIASASGRCCTD